MTEDLKELAEIQPESKFVIIKGESFEIKPFTFINFFSVLSHVSNMIESIDFTPNPYEEPAVTQTKQIIRLLGNHGEDVIGIMAISIGKKADFFNEVSAEEGLELASVIWEINKDFFVRKLQPKLEKMGLNSEKTESPSNDSPTSPDSNTKPSEEIPTEKIPD